MQDEYDSPWKIALERFFQSLLPSSSLMFIIR